MRVVPIAFAMLLAGSGYSVAWAELPVFGSTCVKTTSGATSRVCVKSNGKTLSSSFKWQNKTPSTAQHSGCSMSGETIRCSGGSWRDANGSGTHGPISVKLKSGKPVSAKWSSASD